LPPPYLTDDEIAELCKPLKMPAAQRRHLERMGMIVKTRPNGQPIVARAEFERVMVGAAPGRVPDRAATEPNIAGLEAWATARKSRNRNPK